MNLPLIITVAIVTDTAETQLLRSLRLTYAASNTFFFLNPSLLLLCHCLSDSRGLLSYNFFFPSMRHCGWGREEEEEE